MPANTKTFSRADSLINIKSFVYKLTFIMTALAAVLYCLYFYPQFLPQDQSMYLYAGQLILDGQIPFKDFFDINPPLIMYVNAGIVYFSKMFQVSPISFFKVFVLGIYSLLFFTSYKFFQSLFPLRRKDFYVFFLLITLMLVTHVFYYFWGQRDEIFAVSLMPYLLLKCFRLKNIRENTFPRIHPLVLGFVTGCLGIAVCLKPYFFLHVIGVEAIFFFHLKNKLRFITAEIIGILIILLTYLGFLLALPEPAFSNFWLKHVPSVWQYYDSFNMKSGDPFLSHLMISIPFVAVAGFLISKRPLPLIIWIFISQGLIAFIVAGLQKKVFLYHFSISYVISVYLFYLCILHFRDQKGVSLKFFYSVFILGLICISGQKGFKYFYDVRNTEHRFSYHLNNMLREFTKPGDCVLSFSAVPRVSFPAINNLGLKNCSRYLFQYKLSFFGDHRDIDLSIKPSASEDLAWLEQEVAYFEELKEDIRNNKPDLIYFYTYPGTRQNLPRDFPIDRYISLYGLLTMIEKDYKMTTRGIFTVYLRREESRPY